MNYLMLLIRHLLVSLFSFTTIATLQNDMTVMLNVSGSQNTLTRL